MKALRWAALGLLASLMLAGALVLLADTSIGHRLIAERIERLAPTSGLKVRIGRIEGSIYGSTRIADLRLSDTRGVFFEAARVELDWQPFDYLSNMLTIDRLRVPAATLRRLPVLKPSAKPGPILPGFDIAVGALTIERLAVGEQPRMLRVEGRADVRAGRARLDLAVRGGGDRITVKLDSEPDRDRFDLDARIDASAGGALMQLTQMRRPFALVVDGAGRWQDWRGRLVARAGSDLLAELALSARRGRYDVNGRVRPSLVTSGRIAALTGPSMRIIGNATLADRRLQLGLSAASPALALGVNGTIDLAASAFDAMRIEARLLRPEAALPTMRGQGIAARVLLDGPLRTARFDYAVTAPRVVFGTSGFEDVRVVGVGRVSPTPVLFPIRLTARRATGMGTIAGGILSNLSVDGLLRVTPKLITGDGLRLRSDSFGGTLSVLVDLVTGRYDVALAGELRRLLIPGLGIVDIRSTLKVVPSAGGGVRVVGRGQAWVRRLDNGFLAGLTDGLPTLETDLERQADGVISFTNTVLRSPALTLRGRGIRRTDGSFLLEAVGQHRRYGALRLGIDGDIARPKVDVILAAPFPAAELRAVRAQLVPGLQGYSWTATGGSSLGVFGGNGSILLPRGGAAVIRIGELTVSGVRASGDLTVVTGGVAGVLAMSGGGLDGRVQLAVQGGVQRVAAQANARDVKLLGPPLTVVQRGRLELVALLDPRGTTLDATFNGSGLRRGSIAFARVAASARLVGGVGEVRAAVAGQRGRGFEFTSTTQVTPERFVIAGQGRIDRRPITLTAPAVVRKEGDAWTVEPVTLGFAGGVANVSGRLGGATTQFDATVERLPLAILDIIAPDLALGGTASGRVRYSQAAGGGDPVASASLRVRNLSRAGLQVMSTPVDAGVNILLDARGLAVRAVAVSGGATIGQAQARIAPLGPGDDVVARVLAGQLFAQVRYRGAADTVWRLTGVESFDVSGPVALAADVTGTLARPIIRGTLATDNLRIESPVSGTVLTNLKAQGRFDASRLVVDAFTANAGRGTVSGRASLDLSLANGFGIDAALQAREASLIARDDFAATVTGPIRIVSDGLSGRISGDVRLDRSAFRLGRATAAAEVAELRVREINRPAGSPRVRSAPTLWALDLSAIAADRLAVTGLGLDSEWRADLKLQGTLDAPRIVGRAEIVRGGYEFAGKRFDIRRGVIRFQGAFPPDPALEIVADANIQAIAATISVTGTGQRPEIIFASTPALPPDELLSRLLFGTSITNLSAPEALQLASAVASLRGGGGLDPINAVRRAIGLDRLRFVPADSTVGNKTAIAVGKYITRRAYVEVITDGQGYSATRVEFAITRWLSLLSTISTIGRQSASVRVSRDY